jgi:multidrug efflux pump subunit AcrB
MEVKAKPSASDGYKGSLYKFYRLVLFPCLRFKVLPLMVAFGLLVIAVWALRFVPKVFIPGRTDPVMKAKFDMPRGTDIEVTDSILIDLEQHMLKQYSVKSKQGGITDTLSFIGVGAPRYVLAMTPDPEESHRGAMIIQLENYLMIPDVIRDVQQYAAARYPDLEVKMQKMENGPPIDYPIEVRISGDDIPRLYEIVASVKDKLRETRGVMVVSDNWGPRTKKLAVRVHQDRARRVGISNADVALSLRTGLSGLKMTEFREENDIIPVKLRSVSTDRQDLDKLDGLMVYAQSSQKPVPLKQVADVELVWQNAIISRRNRTRTIVVRTQNFPGVTATEVSSQIIPWLEEAQKSWPPGYTYEMGGEMETSGDTGKAIGEKLPIAGMAILLLLAAQFNSIRKTAIILLTIPLGLIGVTFGLLVANTIFGLFTILGLVSLSGIVVNNAIVLIDRINIEREENGLSASDAVIEACQQRARPIMLTTATTIGGMLPLWISHDPMFETMSVSLIFGLMFGTLLTLVIVPVLYSIFFKVKYNYGSSRKCVSEVAK